MPTRKTCGIYFKNRLFVDGKFRSVNRRRYCLSCVPFKSREIPAAPTGYKICHKCRLCKLLTDFNKDSSKSGGRQGKCRDCSNENSKQHYKENPETYLINTNKRRMDKKAFLISLKDNKKCSDCKVSHRYWILQYDHLRDKKFILGAARSYSKEKILAEIEKCELVCANCHATRTYNRSFKGNKKPTKNTLYVRKLKSGTKCTDCKSHHPYWAMHFDHLRDKIKRIKYLMKSASFERLKEEIEKCEIVCANCHCNRTHERKEKNKALSVKC